MSTTTGIATGQHTGANMKARISYSIGAFGNDVFYATLSTYFIIFVTSHLFNTGDTAHNNRMVLYVTQIIAAVRILELILDPFIGNLIDNTRTRWGKFKPWIVVGGIVGSIALLVLFTNLGGLNESHPVLYLIVFAIIYIIMDMFYSFKDISFWSMVPALSFSSEEREKTATMARIGSTIGGNLVGVVVMPLVLFFSLNKHDGVGDNRGWFMFALIVALVGIFTALVVAFGTKEIDHEMRKNTHKTTLRGVFKALIKNDQLMAISLSYVLYCTGATIINASQLYYFTYILGNAAQFSILGTINMLVGLISVSLFPKLASKFNRRNLFFYCIAVMVLGVVVFFFAGKSLALVLIAAELFFIPQPLVFLVVLMTITDCVEYGQLKLGHRDESLTLSVRPMLDKFAGAIGNLVIGAAAVAAGMTTGATAETVTSSGIWSFKIYIFLIPVILILLGTLVFFFRVKLTEERHAEIVEELERTWGKETASEASVAVRTKKQEIRTPILGYLHPLSDVKDPAFAAGKLGQGFAIKPLNGKVYAPFSGTVKVLFPTNHAIGIESDDGVVLLIHIGLGTTKLKGEGFSTFVAQGQRVEAGQKLIKFDEDFIEESGLDNTVIMTVTNADQFSTIHIEGEPGRLVTIEDNVLELER